MDGDKRAPSREEQAKKAERRKILDRLNFMDTGANHHNSEQEERRARAIDNARERERRPDPGAMSGMSG